MREWLKKSLAILSANGVNFVLNILVIPVLVYSLGFSGYGFYSVYVVVSATFLFLDASLAKSVVGVVSWSGDPDERGHILGSALVTYCLAGGGLLLASPLIGQLVQFLYPLRIGDVEISWWIGIAAVVEYVISLPGQYFQTLNILKGQQLVSAQYQIFVQVSRFVTVALVALIGQSVEWVVAAIVLRKLPDSFVLWLVWRRQERERLARPASRFVGALLRQAGPMVGVALLQVLGTEFVSVYVSHVYGAEVLGKYRSIYDILTKIWVITALYPALVYPMLCAWLGDPVKKSWLREQLPRFMMVSSLLYAGFAQCCVIFYHWFVGQHAAMAETLFFATSLIAGVCMSGHVRLGIELLQAQRAPGAALALNGASLAAGLAVLFLCVGCSLREIGLAWLGSQMTAVILVVVLISGTLQSSLIRSLASLVPWTLVGALAVWGLWRHDVVVSVLSLLLFASLAVWLVVVARGGREGSLVV